MPLCPMACLTCTGKSKMQHAQCVALPSKRPEFAPRNRVIFLQTNRFDDARHNRRARGRCHVAHDIPLMTQIPFDPERPAQKGRLPRCTTMQLRSRKLPDCKNGMAGRKSELQLPKSGLRKEARSPG